MATQFGIAEVSQNAAGGLFRTVRRLRAAARARKASRPEAAPKGVRLPDVHSEEANHTLNLLVQSMSSMAVRMDSFGIFR